MKENNRILSFDEETKKICEYDPITDKIINTSKAKAAITTVVRLSPCAFFISYTSKIIL